MHVVSVTCCHCYCLLFKNECVTATFCHNCIVTVLRIFCLCYLSFVAVKKNKSKLCLTCVRLSWSVSNYRSLKVSKQQGPVSSRQIWPLVASCRSRPDSRHRTGPNPMWNLLHGSARFRYLGHRRRLPGRHFSCIDNKKRKSTQG